MNFLLFLLLLLKKREVFNKETEYALRGLVYIQLQNNRERRPGIAEIAKEIETPQFYMAKILQRLTRQGLVKSTKGKGGGFYFDKTQPELSLKEILKVTEGTDLLTGCGFGLSQCNDKNPCPMHDRFVHIREGIQKMVTEETVQSLALKAMSGQATLKSLIQTAADHT